MSQVFMKITLFGPICCRFYILICCLPEVNCDIKMCILSSRRCYSSRALNNTIYDCTAIRNIFKQKNVLDFSANFTEMICWIEIDSLRKMTNFSPFPILCLTTKLALAGRGRTRIDWLQGSRDKWAVSQPKISVRFCNRWMGFPEPPLTRLCESVVIVLVEGCLISLSM